jgi:hypothetical protein
MRRNAHTSHEKNISQKYFGWPRHKLFRARVPGSMKILISNVHKRSGLLSQRYREFYGKDNDDILVVYGTTLQFNPSFDKDIIERALAEDPERYGAEYLSKWRDDLFCTIPMPSAGR